MDNKKQISGDLWQVVRKSQNGDDSRGLGVKILKKEWGDRTEKNRWTDKNIYERKDSWGERRDKKGY